MSMTMVIKKQVAKNEVKARLLEYFRYIEETGEEIIVTDHGRPAVRICPIRAADRVEDAFAGYRGTVKIGGNPTAPVDGDWEIS